MIWTLVYILDKILTVKVLISKWRLSILIVDAVSYIETNLLLIITNDSRQIISKLEHLYHVQLVRSSRFWLVLPGEIKIT